MISIENIHKKFGEVKVLDGVSLEIKPGGLFAILGPNGSGKTTLIKSILGMVLPESGDILLQGKNIRGKHNYRAQIDYLPQIAQFPDNIMVSELVKMVKDLREIDTREGDLIELFQLEPYLNKKLGNLSGGTRQKVNLVLTFMFDSPLLILDEPTTGLDPVSLLHLKELIEKEKKNGKTILVTTHIMDFVEEMADEIVFLLEGKVYFKGTLDKLKNQTSEEDLEHAIAHILKSNHDQNTSI